MISNLVEQSLSNFDAVSKARLMKCTPMLEQVLDNWTSQPGIIDTGTEVILAVATPASAVLICSDHWLALDQAAVAQIDRTGVVVALAHAAEQAPTPESSSLILTGLCALLGAEGVASKMTMAQAARARGQLPLNILLIGDNAVAAEMMLTLPVVGERTVH